MREYEVWRFGHSPFIQSINPPRSVRCQPVSDPHPLKPAATPAEKLLSRAMAVAMLPGTLLAFAGTVELALEMDILWADWVYPVLFGAAALGWLGALAIERAWPLLVGLVALLVAALVRSADFLALQDHLPRSGLQAGRFNAFVASGLWLTVAGLSTSLTVMIEYFRRTAPRRKLDEDDGLA